MNFLKFINSNAIRKHLKEIEYEFAPTEAAYVIWQSDSCSMQEKHEAWKHLIENTEDEDVILMTTPAYRKSLTEELGDSFGLHTYLKEYMQIEDRIAGLAMKDEENTVFSFEMYYKDDCDTCEDKRLFSSFAQLMEAIDAKKEYMSKYELEWIFIKKQWIDTEEKFIKLKLKTDKTVYCLTNDCNVRSEHESKIETLFENMWFKIPVPFEKGDIVHENFKSCCMYDGKDMPFVLEKVCYWGIDDIEDTKRRHAWGSMDMTADGYFITDDGRLYGECVHNYLLLEYYTDEPQGVKRTLKALSNFEKKKIDVGLLMDAYSIILNEERIAHHRKYLGVTNQGLKLAGLKKDSMIEKLFPDCVNKYPDGLYTIAGRPAMGKSLVANVIASEMINLYEKKVKYIQCEEIVDVALSRKIKAEYDFLYEVGISIDKIEEELKNPDIDVLIIDSYNYMDRKDVDCAAELKRLSSKYRKTIFALSSISRKADSRKNKRPVKADMTKQMCDSLWDNSDGVVFLYRDSYYDENAENNELELIIEKGNSTYGRYKYDFSVIKRRGGLQ